MDILTQLISGKDIVTTRTSLNKTYITEKAKASDLPSLVDDGWEKAKDYKNPAYILVKKDLSSDVLFSNKLWVLFSSMGFTTMNGSKNFGISFDSTSSAGIHHFDVLAADEETVILVECKYSSFHVESNFQDELENFQNHIGGIRQQLQKTFGKRKVKIIWALHNFIMRKLDIDAMSKLGIMLFDDSTINYYCELVKHIGSASKYQLLGNLFAKQEIANMENRIPAIQGKMGGYTYYSFSIEPEKLLKIGYVLHRNEANSNMMPTYQRLIKKKRLQEVRAFIDNGGYFPNSIIISIDTDGKKLVFQPAGTKIENTISKIGILYIPKKYHSAYIIDGQHRLYGYSDSDYASSNTIPVVAFVDLDRNEQIKLFMDINENQKAVPKSLRVTLNADMLWDSEDKTEQRQALRSKIAQMLGERSASPLKDRIIVGEGETTPFKSVTVEAIQTALKKTNFFSTYAKKNNAILTEGTFETENNDENCNLFYPFLEDFMIYIQKNCPDEWNKTDDELGMIVMNRGIQALIRVLDDVVNMLVEKEMIYPKKQSFDDMMGLISYYMSPLIESLKGMPNDERKEHRMIFGGGGDTRFWRVYQRSIADKRPDFRPEGLSEFWQDESKSYNEETKTMLIEIEKKLKEIIRFRLEDYFGDNWLASGLPRNVFKSLKDAANNVAYNMAQNGIEGEEPDPWDYVSIPNCKEIALNAKNWSSIFSTLLVRDEEAKLPGDKDVKTDWMLQINRINNKLGQKNYSVPAVDYQFVMSVHNWIMGILIL